MSELAPKPCRVCGEHKAVEEMVKDRNICIQCNRKIHLARYHENRAANLIKKKEYYDLHRDEIIAKVRRRRRSASPEDRAKVASRKRTYAAKNKAKISVWKKAYRERNKDAIAAKDKEYREANKEAIRAREKKRRESGERSRYAREWYEKHKQERAEYNAQYREKNRDAINAYFRDRRARDPIFRMSGRIRSRIGAAIRKAGRGQANASRSLEYLGCSPQQAAAYIESMFADGMTWENADEWHIDHVIPVASYDLTDESQIYKAFHYTNLQPLWANDNLSKGAKVPEKPHQPRLLLEVA